ncbi:hypothetical protein [Mycolicibacterium chlorophenolicum]|uniref:hypothetical protein n=1 Tax=Mycolicibacterium chlorophenolicum TaxID=37916 RepID=UPI0013017D26
MSVPKVGSHVGAAGVHDSWAAVARSSSALAWACRVSTSRIWSSSLGTGSGVGGWACATGAASRSDPAVTSAPTMRLAMVPPEVVPTSMTLGRIGGRWRRFAAEKVLQNPGQLGQHLSCRFGAPAGHRRAVTLPFWLRGTT